jgi:hypothetical protein
MVHCVDINECKKQAVKLQALCNHLIIFNFFKDGGQFLDVLLTILRRKSVVDSEELVHSVLSTLNNLSYYPTSDDGAFGERQLEIAQGTLHCV